MSYVPPTEKMWAYMLSLAGSHQLPSLGADGVGRRAAVTAMRERRSIDKWRAMGLIDELKAAPLDVEGLAVKPGVYRRNGEVFVVQLNRDKTNVYAKRLVQSADRVLDVDGETIVKADFEYAPGALSTLRPEDQLTLEQAHEYLVRYTHCMICGRSLKAARSVIDTIGPVCRQMFRSEEDDEPDPEVVEAQESALDELLDLLG